MKTEGCSILTGEVDETSVSFHGYLNGRDVSQGWPSLDEALAGLIAIKHEGPNSRAGDYFMRMMK